MESAQPQLPRHETMPMRDTGLAGGRILLVEDHPTTLLVLARLIERLGYEVRTAATVAAAKQMAEREHPDLLVSDLGLPDGSGYELMIELRKTQPVLGIALSGYGMEDDVRQSQEAGFAEHLVKPVGMQQLAETISRVLHSPENPPATSSGTAPSA